MGDRRIILASASPRRREILQSNGFDFEVVPADVDESAIVEKSPKRLTMALSRAKAEAIDAKKSAIVIGADTVVVYKGRVFGKPHTVENAIATLEKLCGRWHKVYTGVTVLCEGKRVCFAVRSRVKLKAFCKAEIIKYVEDTNPLDKAGAYGIQDGRIVEKYEGSYTNIVGLPMEKLAKVLARFGVTNGNG